MLIDIFQVLWMFEEAMVMNKYVWKINTANVYYSQVRQTPLPGVRQTNSSLVQKIELIFQPDYARIGQRLGTLGSHSSGDEKKSS